MGCIPAGMAEVPAHWDSGKLGGHDRGWGTGSFSTLEEKVFQVKTSAIATYLPNISKYGLRRSQICKVTCISIYQYHILFWHILTHWSFEASAVTWKNWANHLTRSSEFTWPDAGHSFPSQHEDEKGAWLFATETCSESHFSDPENGNDMQISWNITIHTGVLLSYTRAKDSGREPGKFVLRTRGCRWFYSVYL